MLNKLQDSINRNGLSKNYQSSCHSTFSSSYQVLPNIARYLFNTVILCFDLQSRVSSNLVSLHLLLSDVSRCGLSLYQNEPIFVNMPDRRY